MPQLRYIDDAGSLRTVTLGTQPLLIGRVNTCEIVFVDDMISREHTRIEREPDGRYRIRDLGSRNKTHVNGQQVSETLTSFAWAITSLNISTRTPLRTSSRRNSSRPTRVTLPVATG